MTDKSTKETEKFTPGIILGIIGTILTVLLIFQIASNILMGEYIDGEQIPLSSITIVQNIFCFFLQVIFVCVTWWIGILRDLLYKHKYLLLFVAFFSFAASASNIFTWSLLDRSALSIMPITVFILILFLMMIKEIIPVIAFLLFMFQRNKSARICAGIAVVCNILFFFTPFAAFFLFSGLPMRDESFISLIKDLLHSVIRNGGVTCGMAAIWCYEKKILSDNQESGREQEPVQPFENKKILLIPILLICLFTALLEAELFLKNVSRTAVEKGSDFSLAFHKRNMNEYNTFRINETDLSLPMTFDEFKNVGFQVSQLSDISNMVDSDDSAWFLADFSDGSSLGTVYVYNNSDKAQPMDQCAIISFELNDCNRISSDAIHLEFADELTLASTKTEVFQYLGDPDNESSVNQDDYSEYTWYEKSSQENGWNFISITFSYDIIDDIRISCKEH